MSKRLPVISGKELIRFLQRLGYAVVRQRGSHIRLEKTTKAGVHKITVPFHDPIAKGTLNDILNKVGIWNQMSRETLVQMIDE